MLKGVLRSSHGLVHIADLGQGHLADDLWWSGALKPCLATWAAAEAKVGGQEDMGRVCTTRGDGACRKGRVPTSRGPSLYSPADPKQGDGLRLQP